LYLLIDLLIVTMSTMSVI